MVMVDRSQPSVRAASDTAIKHTTTVKSYARRPSSYFQQHTTRELTISYTCIQLALRMLLRETRTEACPITEMLGRGRSARRSIYIVSESKEEEEQ
jgi:hypothetical protein